MREAVVCFWYEYDDLKTNMEFITVVKVELK
jgi:hypothetical protein